MPIAYVNIIMSTVGTIPCEKWVILGNVRICRHMKPAVLLDMGLQDILHFSCKG